MASLERNSLQQPTRLIYKDSVIFKNPCASVPSKSVSITESILRSQWGVTPKTKRTVQNQASFLKRVTLNAKGREMIYNPSWIPSRLGMDLYPVSRLNTPQLIYGTFVESKSTSRPLDLFPHDTTKLRSDITTDLQGQGNRDGHWKRQRLSHLI